MTDSTVDERDKGRARKCAGRQRRGGGLNAAGGVLGHELLAITETYVEIDAVLAAFGGGRDGLIGKISLGTFQQTFEIRQRLPFTTRSRPASLGTPAAKCRRDPRSVVVC